MMSLYTAIGVLKFQHNFNGNAQPIVLNNHQEYGLSEHELILWSCLAFQILQNHELKSAYESRLQSIEAKEALSFSHYLNRLILRGLVAVGAVSYTHLSGIKRKKTVPKKKQSSWMKYGSSSALPATALPQNLFWKLQKLSAHTPVPVFLPARI